MKIEVTNLTLRDDLKAVSSLLYLADPYAYPPWFNNTNNALVILEYLMRESDIFSYQNIIVAKSLNNEIIGILLYIKKQDTYNLDVFNNMWATLKIKESKAHNETLEGYIKEIIKFTSDYYLLNLAVAPTYQGKGIAKALLSAFETLIQTGSISLEVISENVNAVRLYQKAGYNVSDKFKTFCLFDDTLTSYHMVKNVSPSENF